MERLQLCPCLKPSDCVHQIHCHDLFFNIVLRLGFPCVQALGLKLLRTIERPEYKVTNPLLTKHYDYVSSVYMSRPY